MKRKIELAWAAGFIDGEGCIHAKTHWGQGFRVLALTVTQVERDPLDRLVKIFGGKVLGPRNPPSHRGRPFYVWRSPQALTEEILDSLLPYLCEKQRRRYEEAIAQVERSLI